MANRATSVTLVVVTLLIAAAGIAGILWLLYKLPATVAALVAGGIGFSVTKLYESWKESRHRLHDKKRDVYAKLLAPFLALHLQILKGEGDRPAPQGGRGEMPTQLADGAMAAA